MQQIKEWWGKWFSYRADLEEAIQELNSELVTQDFEIRRLEKIITELRMQRATQKSPADVLPVIGIDWPQDEPQDSKARAAYIQEVDNFFTGILEPKLKTAIGEVRHLLGSLGREQGLPDMPRSEYDSFLRGMEAGLKKIYNWGVTCSAERRAVNNQE